MKRTAAVTVLVALLGAEVLAQRGVMPLPPIQKRATPQAVVDEHLDAINKCDWTRLMAQYPPNVEFFSPNGVLTQGRAAVAELFRNFVKPAKDGGLCGMKFTTIHSFVVGDTINVMWEATAPFLSEPYKGADAYVTKDGLMFSQVTTFNSADIKMKK